jgi:hypothetical protein
MMTDDARLDAPCTAVIGEEVPSRKLQTNAMGCEREVNPRMLPNQPNGPLIGGH